MCRILPDMKTDKTANAPRKVNVIRRLKVSRNGMVSIALYLPVDLNDQLTDRALSTGTTRMDLIRQAVADYLAR